MRLYVQRPTYSSFVPVLTFDFEAGFFMTEGKAGSANTISNGTCGIKGGLGPPLNEPAKPPRGGALPRKPNPRPRGPPPRTMSSKKSIFKLISLDS